MEIGKLRSPIRHAVCVMYRKSLVLDRYDSTRSPLGTFLAKFRNCVRYNKWSTDDHAVFLRHSLTGNACQIHWELSDEANDEELIGLLRNRFGNTNQNRKQQNGIYHSEIADSATTNENKLN